LIPRFRLWTGLVFGVTGDQPERSSCSLPASNNDRHRCQSRVYETGYLFSMLVVRSFAFAVVLLIIQFGATNRELRVFFSALLCLQVRFSSVFTVRLSVGIVSFRTRFGFPSCFAERTVWPPSGCVIELVFLSSAS